MKTISLFKMGDVKERASSTSVAGPARKEVAFAAAARQFPALPHDGDQSENSGESAARRRDSRLRTSARNPGQSVAHLQRRTCVQDDESAQRTHPPLLPARLVPCRCPGTSSLLSFR